MDSTAGGPSGGTGSDCEGEDQEDSSSSSPQLETETLDNLTLKEDTKPKEEEDTLSSFRQQWQRELVATPSPQRQLPKNKTDTTPAPENDEEKAQRLFLSGIELERSGKLYEAVQQYKRAVQLCPDVEKKLYQASGTEHTPTPEAPPPTQPSPARDVPEDTSSPEGHEDLLTRLQRLMAAGEALCEPELPQKGSHISCLPHEVVSEVLRWVVSAELDAASLERAGGACRGLYVAAREPRLWRAMCFRIWGKDCGHPKAHNYPTWRAMFIDRPRLNLNGCYISKTTYLRHGENAYQDTFYKPWYLIEYYRYLRFFPEGLVLMWTTAEEPASCVGHLKHRTNKNLQGIMSGHYRLIGNKLIIVLKKTSNDKRPAQSSNTRFRSRRKDSLLEQQQQEQTFHLEFELCSVKRRRNSQLIWRGYSVSNRRDQWTSFELQAGKYPPFYFSRVRNYTAEATAPLI